ncbi:DUF4123 domain-containing protein [Marinobacter sp. JSM 1782161]|uniref:DUF4123 domain-containing protein n=1 Tax=Marinobacter sp. JSM 1782161 TaxID=2685906 RepID=UPI00140349BE|nr:DUF4123 domain-containing protein [Marinobacter sp. JSM 1782161]
MSDRSGVKAGLDALLETRGPSDNLYLVLSGTSECQPVRHYFSQDGANALPLYMGTPYAGWQEVMPYLAAITPDSPFLEWIKTEADADWGWAALSSAYMDRVFSHLRSLTQITLASGKDVFFRYWDARFLGPIIDQLDPNQQASLMGPVTAWADPHGQLRQTPPARLETEAKPFPWFHLPASVEKGLAANSRDQLVDNALTALEKLEPSPIAPYPKPVARQKVARQLRRLLGDAPVSELDSATFKTLRDRLRHEAGRHG